MGELEEWSDIMAGVKLSNLHKKFPNGFEAVKNMSLEIADKEFIVFVGPSGCGKTTTLRMIAGLEEATEGEIQIDGKAVTAVAPKNRDIAMVFQNYALYPHLTVFKNMSFGLALRKTPKPEITRKVHEAAKMLGIEQLLDRKPKQLSGGERQRVAMGRAIVREPKVFLMDEPLSNLDAKLRVQMREEIAKLYQKLQTTFIYVTHDQAEAMTLGTRIVVMKDGVIQQADTPLNIYNHPANLFVAGFIGSPQMNFFEAVFADGALKVCGKTLTLPPERKKTLDEGGYNGKSLMLGIRPLNIRLSEHNGDNTLPAVVEIVEQFGSEIHLHLNLAGIKCVVVADPEAQFCIRKAVNIEFDLKKAHLFDKESGDMLQTQQLMPA
jgi:multiple sugar transport system ATP-binding protein